MRKLSLSNEILLSIEKPARYIGGEINSVIKNKEDVDVRFCMCFPDVYELGMSHLGIQIIYDMLNKIKGVWCERVYSPWIDLDKILREKNIPLFALESQDSIREFDFLGITIQYELCYTNILQILELGQIPLLAKERTDNDPIVIGGGPCTYNPEPIAEFFDIFYIGEGETKYYELIDLYKKHKKSNYSRNTFLKEAAKIEGLYIPSLYKEVYENNKLVGRKEYFNAPRKVKREIVKDFDNVIYPLKPVISNIKAIQDRIVLEIQRGCIRGCRFCQAGYIYRPLRSKSISTLKKNIDELIKNTGFDEISLSSLSSSDYKYLKELTEYLLSISKERNIKISLPSLRVDEFSLEIMSKIEKLNSSSITFAPEAGSQRLRDIINKGITKEDILDGCKKAFLLGWKKIKLYFMLGLPFETAEDIQSIPTLADEIAKQYYSIPKEKRNGKCDITISTSFFVPKPFTPFQWESGFYSEKYMEKAKIVLDTLKEQINKKSINYKYHSPDATILENILARGDRRLSSVILRAYKNDCLFDAWSDTFCFDRWIDAFEKEKIDIDYYIGKKNIEDVLPWDFIDIGIDKEYFIKERDKALKGKVTQNCRKKCNGCLCFDYKSGVCSEIKN